ncbi:hypothetical protein F2Q69_00049177 [Brassica cretica]|uniref:Uncharacterized protein n=1 Tax=Brassica cretica TaxID=69181 RepID=A0A8S9PUZ9_BRACR|nr:hypothetical protein F2Q69_00049177 [Brassica cretica]
MGRPRPVKLCQENPQRFCHHRIVPRPQITRNRKNVGSRNPNLCISLCRVAAQSPRKNTPSTAPVHEKNQRRRRQTLEPHRPRTEATTIDRRDTKTLDLSYGTIAQGPPDARRLLVFTESCLLRQVERIPRSKRGGDIYAVVVIGVCGYEVMDKR